MWHGARVCMHFRRIPFPRLSRGSETLIDQNDFKQQGCRIIFQTNRNDLEAPWGGGGHVHHDQPNCIFHCIC